ncbi:MAG: hypothetical protein NW206_06150 [Hyphomonadaceae bacterium]|nr:hypothetical protein [Hyphomonadaceae bacterium]
MDRRSAIIIMLIGVAQVVPPLVLFYFAQQVGGEWALFPVSGYALLWMICSGPGLILWGALTLLTRKPNA